MKGECPRNTRWLVVVGLVLVLGCRRSPTPVDPAAAAVVAVRVHLGGASRAAQVTVGTGRPGQVVLRATGGGPGELEGSIVLGAGGQTLSFEASGERGEPVARASVPLELGRGAAAQLDVALAGAGAPPPLVLAVAAPDSSPVEGQPTLLRAQLSAPGVPGTALRWSSSPPGCGRFGTPTEPSTPFTGLAAGPCRATLLAATGSRSERRSLELVIRSTGRSFTFPLRPAAGGRFLEDQAGRPFLLKGETAWLALVNLTEAEQETYLADRARRGFNLVEVMLVNHDYTTAPNPTPPANRQGEQPFLQPGDFSTPSDRYFDRAAAFVDRAAAHGLVVLLAPGYLGFDGGREGWWEPLTSPGNTQAVCFRLGQYLGARFKDRQNVVWLAGGDFAPPPGSEGERRHWEIRRGIQAAGARQPWTGHWNVAHQGGLSTDQALFAPGMDLNGIYRYAATWEAAARAYEVRPIRPTFLLESTYEHEHPSKKLQPFRKAWWWTMLTGGSGVIWSNYFLWRSESARGTHRASYGDTDGVTSSWAAELDSAGTHQMLRLHGFFEGLPWQRLIPAGVAGGGAERITSGQRRGEGHIASAATAEGDLLVAYVPPTGEPARRFTVDLSRLGRPLRGRWYDPAGGVFVATVGVPSAAGVWEVQVPGVNASGLDDWVLLLDRASPDG